VSKKKGMSEEEWLGCADPGWMLGVLSPIPQRRLNIRSLSLFACACCQRIRRMLPDEFCHRAVDLTERLAGGLADPEELQTVREQIEAAWPDRMDQSVSGMAASAAYFAAFDAEAARQFQEVADWQGVSNYDKLLTFFKDCAAACAAEAVSRVRAKAVRSRVKRYDAERVVQADLLRDIFGNPFRSVALDPSWRTPTVVALAQATYDKRSIPTGTLAPDQLAVLADALEDAGCTDATILDHLRGPGPHVRGCHVVDLLTGKE
jgi:hypothetical protein